MWKVVHTIDVSSNQFCSCNVIHLCGDWVTASAENIAVSLSSPKALEYWKDPDYEKTNNGTRHARWACHPLATVPFTLSPNWIKACLVFQRRVSLYVHHKAKRRLAKTRHWLLSIRFNCVCRLANYILYV